MVAPILDHMTALSDPTRCRMLLLLEKHELTVVRALLGAPAAAVNRQPSSEDAGRRWVGDVEAGRNEPLLHDAGR